jgi:lycopene cyclase domain-containing protein
VTTYLVLNLLVLVVAGCLLWPALKKLNWRVVGITLALLLVLALVFDNLIVSSGIVAYNPATTLQINTPIAPIEDYCYAIAAAIGLPALWNIFGKIWPKHAQPEELEK